ncbi:MAG: hypothetical protein OEM66_05440 [Acidimicrobiia bacterium]|nr:hypothetical protein [Acidimicrobiia bacterium]
MSGFSSTEMLIVAMAREFRDGEVIVMGAVPRIPLAACRVAKALHAPGLTYIVGGSGTVNPTAFPQSSCDPALGEGVVALPLTDVVLLEGRGDILDVFCAGGLQIDAFGNCNLSAVGDWAKPSLRGPGTVGLPFLPATKRSVIYTTAHNPKTLVERVDFISGPGHARSADLDRPYRREGPSLVVTPMATLDFDPQSRRMRVRSVHPGCTESEVREATGFDLGAGYPVSVTPMPTDQELHALRQIDVDRA